ncbi:MAG: hypothetical protein AAFX50_02885 [Acidobacteriota bacterium]
MRAYVCLVVLVAAFVALSSADPARPQPPTSAAPAPAEAAAPAAIPDRGLAARMWWNQPKKIEELGLGDTQRATMDGALRRFAAVRAEAIRRQKIAFAAYGDALASGDAAAIESRGEALRAAMSAPLEGQVDLMAEVTAMLTADQRRRLVERYPKLLSRQWIRSGRGLGAGGRGR